MAGGYGYAPPGAGFGPPPSYYGSPYGASSPPRGMYFDPYSNPVLQSTLAENQFRWGGPLPLSQPQRCAKLRVRSLTPDGQIKSLHAQAEGDVWMRKLKFLNAYDRYKVAIRTAPDRPEPYFRMGFALAAVGSFDSAVKYIKDGLDLDPQWPSHGDRLESIFGEDNRLMILSLTERIAMWVREDIRDPDRLFLMGVWLHFDGDNRATPFFETAYRLAGYGDHLLAFLLPGNGAGGQPFAGPPGHTHETFPADPSRPGLFQPGPLAPNSTQPNSAQPNTPQFNPNNGPPPIPQPPAPMEPQETLGPQGVVPQDTNRSGNGGPALTPKPMRRGPFIQPRQPMYQPPDRSAQPGSPMNPPAAPVPQQSVPQQPVPQQPVPQQPVPQQSAPQGPTQQAPVPPVPTPSDRATPSSPALPVPPLPAPQNGGPNSESSSSTAPSGGTPSSDGPLLLPPAGDNNVTAIPR